jgi:hypothetical protein
MMCGVGCDRVQVHLAEAGACLYIPSFSRGDTERQIFSVHRSCMFIYYIQ